MLALRHVLRVGEGIARPGLVAAFSSDVKPRIPATKEGYHDEEEPGVIKTSPTAEAENASPAPGFGRGPPAAQPDLETSAPTATANTVDGREADAHKVVPSSDPKAPQEVPESNQQASLVDQERDPEAISRQAGTQADA